MKILHTSDWHLGKHLEGYSRLDEQEKFIEELIEIVEKNEIDIILVSGDIYDNFNPPAEAEKLFYWAMDKLSNNGEKVICIISGNHDSPNRLIAPSPLTYNQGIIIVDTPQFKIEKGRAGSHQIVRGGKGFLELKIKDENVVLLALPYPSESRLNEVLADTSDEKILQEEYSKKVGEIFTELEKNYREDTINIAMSHLFVAGSETSDSERPIQVGGGLTVYTEHLPKKSQFTALGHLHRSQVACRSRNAYYAGSPIQYSKNERNNSKSVTIVELHPGEKAQIETIPIKNRKPIEVWEADGVDEAIAICQKNKERPVWAYLQIYIDRSLLQSEIKRLKEIKPDILSIIPVTSDERNNKDELMQREDLDIMSLFTEYYQKVKEVKPDDEIIKMFASIVNEEEVG